MDFIDSVAQVIKGLENEDEVVSRNMAVKIGMVDGLCTFPVVAQMVLKILSSDNYKMSNVSAVVNRDPALAAKVMRLANSAFFCRGKPADTLDKAMIRLGRANVIESVCAIATMEMFPDVDGIGKEIRDHCAATAAICQELVTELLPSHKSGAFLCGLMHDIGKLLLISSNETLYAEMTAGELKSPNTTVAIERRVLGYDHAVLAGQILWHWKFPAPIPQVVALHHEPALAYQDENVGFVVAMCRISSQIERQLSQNTVSVDDFIAQIVDEVDCQFAAVSEDYLFGKWENFQAARTASLSVFGSG